MPIDITPRVGAGRQIIERYGNGGFRIAGTRHEGSVLILGDVTLPWPVISTDTLDAATLASTLAPVLNHERPPRILIVGCGRTFGLKPAGLDEVVRAAGVGLEWMDTGAACRTFNVLLLEDREVAAALIAV